MVAERGTASHRPTFCFARKMSGSGKFREDSAQPQHCSHTFSSHRFYYNFTDITIATPPLTRIFNRLIGGGINSCGDGV